MKRILDNTLVISLYMIIVMILLVQFSSCSKSGDATPAPASQTAQQTVTSELTANTWKLQSMTVDGVDQTSLYKGLIINFTSTNFTTTNGGVVWPATGTWSYTSATDASTIKRDDGIVVSVTATASTLQLSLTWTKTTLGGGRTESIKGQNVFNFTK